MKLAVASIILTLFSSALAGSTSVDKSVRDLDRNDNHLVRRDYLSHHLDDVIDDIEEEDDYRSLHRQINRDRLYQILHNILARRHRWGYGYGYGDRYRYENTARLVNEILRNRRLPGYQRGSNSGTISELLDYIYPNSNDENDIEQGNKKKNGNNQDKKNDNKGGNNGNKGGDNGNKGGDNGN